MTIATPEILEPLSATEKKPTTDQQAIIDCFDKICVVQAGPGTGKTYTLLHKIKKIVDDGLLKPTQKILFVTYTNALTSNNRQALVEKLGEQYLPYVEISTLDAFLVKLVGMVAPQCLEYCEKFEGEGYRDASHVFEGVLHEIQNKDLPTLKLIAQRFPYLLVDEIQDLSEQETVGQRPDQEVVNSAKYLFLSRIFRTTPICITLVGDLKQAIKQGNLGKNPLVCKNKKTLSESFRNTTFTNIDHTNLVEKVVVDDQTKFEQCCESDLKIKMPHYINCDETKSIFIQRRGIEDLKTRVASIIKNVPYFIYGFTNNGHYTLPQAIIETLLWKSDPDSKKNPALLTLPFKGMLKTHSFACFKNAYFKALNQTDAKFKKFMNADWLGMLDSENEQIKKLKEFKKQHSHLNELSVQSFKKLVVLSTIDSLKGLEADVVFLFGNPNPKGHKFVAFTRHRKKLYLVKETAS
jgi:superfamily I DNA/RNA helicase